ncbi:hypothetical protein LC087_19345 (plasmid) [Bacillus carboniphilus]|uniref:Uncharacterized protein n=1 Tax=Bacillus carboniphilus TaxID=86663 RepID=A0ABY9JYR2_9BACI|nr:hypothetical protein [Bacillus carboniphilus]WLR44524.1 hypothetical protein LC087_19345 [Bacillus carboniphilus]
MTRRLASHKQKGPDNEILSVLTIYEEGLSKQDIKKMTPYSKKHGVLIKSGKVYEFKD